MSDEHRHDQHPQLDPFDEVKARVSLEDYFINYLKCDLRPEGTNRLACRCPWHEERTPSLKIYLDDNSFRCFGACDFGGSIIDAVMRTEGFEYPLEAVHWLNDHYKLGIDIKAWRLSENVVKAREKIAQAQAEMNDPNSKVAARAREILQERGFAQETWEHFGLAVDKEAARILIPIYEKGGHPVAWSGRAMFSRLPCPLCKQMVEAAELHAQRSEAHNQGHDGHPKFCKHPDCLAAARRCPHCQGPGGENAGKPPALPAFLADQHPKYDDATGYNKGSNLYNLYGARKLLRKQKDPQEKTPILVMEGFADVWACHQAGFAGAVAYTGSSLTQKQAGEIARLVKSLGDGRWVGLIPDFDVTGRIRLYKNIEMLRSVMPEMDIRVLHGLDQLRYTDPETGEEKACKDPADVLQHHGEAVLAELLERNWWMADEHKIRNIVEGDWDIPQQIELVHQILSEARHTIAVDGIVPLLAERWGRDESVVRTFLHQSASRGAGVIDSASIIASIEDAQRAAEEYLAEDFVITTDYERINDCLPGGGFRLGQLCMILGKSGTGKTTLMANLLWQFLRRQNLPCVFFSLEQPKSQVYITLTQIALGVTSKEAEELIKNRDERLQEVNQLFQNLTIVDNVPRDDAPTQEMTPARVAKLLHEINLTRSEEPVKVVCIDHLGIIKAEPHAPSKVHDDPSGWAMEQFFHICKQTQTFFIVLQQLPKEVEPGQPVSYDQGRGASQQTDFCDYIITIWRPDQARNLSDEDRVALAGQYKFCLDKNRHGPNKVIAHLTFDHSKRRITTESQYGVPDAFLPEIAEANLETAETGAPSELFEQFADTDTVGEDPPSWYMS